LLEGSVQEAQESESHILEFQEWVTHVDALLTARVENDLTADDLPDDDQVCVTTLYFVDRIKRNGLTIRICDMYQLFHQFE
jgi:hypothetical protein